VERLARDAARHREREIAVDPVGMRVDLQMNGRIE